MNCVTEQTVEVADHVRSELQHSPYRALHNIAWEYREGVLTLRGRLPSYYLKQVAQTTVSRVAGVGRIVNEIRVEPPVRTG